MKKKSNLLSARGSLYYHQSEWAYSVGVGISFNNNVISVSGEIKMKKKMKLWARRADKPLYEFNNR